MYKFANSSQQNGNGIEAVYRWIPLPWWGLGGSLVMTLASFITALFYIGPNGEHYSFFRYFISELGEKAQSETYWLFNAGLIVGGAMLCVFILGVGLHLRHWLGYIAMAVGIFSSMFASLVGIFPMDNLKVHEFVAMTFFLYGMISVILFSITFVIDAKQTIPRWFALLGVLVVLCFALFLYFPYDITLPELTSSNGLADFNRPTFWLMPFFEWMVFFSVVAWMTALAFYLKRQRVVSPNRRTPQS